MDFEKIILTVIFGSGCVLGGVFLDRQVLRPSLAKVTATAPSEQIAKPKVETPVSETAPPVTRVIAESGVPKFRLLNFFGRPFEELRLETGGIYIAEPANHQESWACSPVDKCTDRILSENTPCSLSAIETIEKAGKLVFISYGENEYMRCGHLPNFDRVKEKLGAERKPDYIFKPTNGDYPNGAVFVGFWENGDVITRMEAVCAIVDPKQQKFENFRNCTVVGYSQKQCFVPDCKDLSFLKNKKQYDF
jgi:hypothetical protein